MTTTAVTMIETPRFGQLLRHARVASALTQEALAERAGIGARTISDLERGVATQPRLETVELLAEALALAAPVRAAFLAAARPSALAAGRYWMTGLSIPAPTPLVGREREMAMLDRFLEHDTGQPPLFLLAGEPGIGKTRLLYAVAEQASAQGWTVLAGGCHRRGGQEPYSPLLDALARYLFALPAESLRIALRGCAWLIRLLPDLAPVLEPLPATLPSPEQVRRFLFGAVRSLLANIAGPSGTLLVLDDLQWAGPDALELLATLIDAPASTPGAWTRTGHAEHPLANVPRVVGAYRDTEMHATDPLGLLLVDLARAGWACRQPLEPLSATAAATLLTALLADGGAPTGIDPALAPRVLERAGGTPFFLVSFAQVLRAAREHGRAPETLDAVPWDVTQSVRQRAALLPAMARVLLDIAAIVGRRVPWPLLVPIAGQTEDQVLHGLEEACRARLLRETDGGSYTFAHDVIREVVEADLSAARQAALHGKVAEALAAATATSPELLAYHYLRGPTPEHAIPHLEQAGDQALAQRAHGAAAIQYREALKVLEHADQPRAAARLREKLAQVLKETGHYQAALDLLAPVAGAHLAGEDWTSLGRITLVIGELHALQGTAGEGLARLRPLLERLACEDPLPVHAPLYLSLGVLLCSSGRYAEGVLANERAVDLSCALGDDRLLVKSTWLRADALQVLGYLEDALAADESVLPLAEAVGDLECLMAVPRDVAYIHAMRGDFVAARRCIDRALALAVQLENPTQCAFSQATRGWLSCLQGDTEQAHADLDQARAFAEQAGRSWHSAYLPIFLASISLIEGMWEATRAAAQEAITLAEESGDMQARRWAACIMAELDILEGQPEQAEARLLPLRDRPGLRECDVTRFLPVLAWAMLARGRVAEAAAVVEQALARARPEQMRLVLVEALRVQALVAMAQGHLEEAAMSLEEGLALARGMPLPHAEARLLHLAGVLCAEQGEAAAAHARFAAASARFAALGVPAGVHTGGAPHASALSHDAAAATSMALPRPKRQAWALARMRAEGPLSPGRYAAALGISTDTALRDLRDLALRGAVVAQGTTKDRRYALVRHADQDANGATFNTEAPKARRHKER